MSPQFYPRRVRCDGCAKRDADCTGLPFSSMPVHRRDGADVVVICTEFRQTNHCASHRDKQAPIRRKHRK